MKKDYKNLDLELLDILDYKVLIFALENIELYRIEVTDKYYYELLSKLERNKEKLEYSNLDFLYGG